MALTNICHLWCITNKNNFQDCCIDSLIITATIVLTLLLFIASKCSKWSLEKYRCGKSSDILIWIRCILGIIILFIHLTEIAEASLAIAWQGISSILAVITPITSILLLFIASVVAIPPNTQFLVRLILLTSWIAGAILRGIRLHHLLNVHDLNINLNTRATTALLCIIFYIILSITEIITIILQRNIKQVVVENEKTGIKTEGYKHSKVSIPSQATFWWLTSLLWKGSNKPIELEDLGHLPCEESTQHLFTSFKKHYDEALKLNLGRTPSLWKCYLKSCGPRFFLGGLYKLFGDLVGLAGPLGISIIIEYAQHVNEYNAPDNFYPTLGQVFSNGYVMGCVVLIASIAQGTFSQASTHLVNVEGIRLKAALQALVYDKSLKLASWSFGETITSNNDNNEQNDPVEHHTDTGAITNLMSDDAYNVMSCLWIGHYVWAIPLKIGVIMWLLYLKLGWSAVLGAALCVIIMTPLQLFIGKRMSTNSKLISEASDERLRKINETLQGIKIIKLYSWEDEFYKRILTVREKELKFLDKDSLYWAIMTFLTHASSAMVTLVTFILYIAFGNTTLTPSDVFSAIALFNQLTVPLFIFPVTVPLIIGAIVSTKRLSDFLSLPEISDTHSPPVIPDEPSIVESHEDSIQVETNPNPVNNCGLCGSNDSVFGPSSPILEHIHEDEEDGVDVPLVNDSSIKIITPAVIISENSNFAWNKDSELPVIKIINKLIIPKAQLSIVVGSVGSGKTSFLSALLGEMHILKGNVTWGSDTSVAYVSQKPWLLNATLRDNILFGQSYRARRYTRVVAACALQPDIALLPAGDLTYIGEKGIALSGGQRQRICVARALYSRASLLLLDDPLSALDAHVAQHVVESGVRRLLMRRQNRTVVLVTHRLQLLHLADNIIAMESGEIRAQGTLSDIEKQDSNLVSDWRTAMTRQAAQEEANKGRGKTARERWQLLRLVSRFGTQIRNSKNIAPDGTWQSDEETPTAPTSSFVPFRRRTFRSSISRCHLSHDLPLPIDECADDFLEVSTRCKTPTETSSIRLPRRLSSKRNVFRTVSLQTSSGSKRIRTPLNLPQLTRQFSTPTIPQNSQSSNTNNVPQPRCRTFTVDGMGRQGSLLRRIFSTSSQRSNRSNPPDNSVPKEKNVLKRLISNSSIRSYPDVERPQVCRLPSSTSAYSEDVNEDEDLGEEEGDESEWGLTVEEEREYGKVKRRVYFTYLKASGLILGSFYILSALIWQGCRVATDYWLSYWTAAETHDNTTIGANRYLLVYAALSIISIVLSLGSNALGQIAGAKARRTLHEKSLHAIFLSPIRFFESTPVGRIINRFATDMAVIDKKISISIQRLMQFLLLCVSAIVVNIIVSPWFAIIAIPVCLIYYWVQRFYRASARELQRLDSLTRSPIFSHFCETLGGLSTIRAFGQQSRFTKMLHNKMDTHRNAFLIMNSSNRWLGIALDYLGGVIVFTAVVTALLSAQFLPELVTPALVGLAINYTLLVPIYLNWVVKFLSDMEMYMTAVERVQQYAKLPSEDYKDKDGLNVPEDWPKDGQICFKDISLRYDTDRDPVISKLNLTISAGQKVGICGRTGSGKSSLAMSLFCMVEAFEGKILIDEYNVLKDVPLSILRSRLSAIPQDAIMFSGTLRDNLDPKNKFTDEELWSALELTQVKSIANALSGGLDGEVREGGENFSAGQRQLLCLARATLHGAKCLILDEATSSLDPITEQKLITAANYAFRNRTVIMIAHRLSTLLTCDRILVLSNGEIVEDATPAELLSKEASVFSEMLRASEEGSIL